MNSVNGEIESKVRIKNDFLKEFISKKRSYCTPASESP